MKTYILISSIILALVILVAFYSFRHDTREMFTPSQCDSLSASTFLDQSSLSYGLTAAQQQEILNTHNLRRAQHGEKPLKWNENLAKTANDWFSKSCAFSHSTTLPYGENLIAGYHYPPCDMWYTAEACALDFSNPTFNAGHTSAILWSSTTDVGCALITKDNCPNGIADTGSSERFTHMIACEYSPPGNIHGQFKDNLHAPLVPLKCVNGQVVDS